MATTTGLSIGGYLIRRLQECGIRHIFGIPGDYILGFYTLLDKSPIEIVGCTREDCAGFAADAYARINGIGAVCVTYCVGGLSLCNSIAGAYAEKSPVVLIAGAPGLNERFNKPLLHHMVRDFRTQFEVFEKLCVAAAELHDPSLAFREIDRVLEAVTSYKRPGFIELPRDLVHVVPDNPYHPTQSREPAGDTDALREAADEAARMIAGCTKPVIIAGVELHRFGLQDLLLTFAEQAQVPITTTMLGKSVIRETHPLFAGLYEGAMGRDEVTRFVEESDCVILLGTFMTDINLGIYTANLDPGKCIYATSEQLRIRHHHFHGVRLEDFLHELIRRKPRPPLRAPPQNPYAQRGKFELRPQEPLTIERMIIRINESLDDSVVVITDVGDCMFAATELVIQQRTEFLGPYYYTSMGFSVPAALGAQVGRRDLRPIAIVGDGAFQMTCMELSTIVRHELNAIVIVLDNEGYNTERLLHPGDFKFNEVLPWKYHKIPEVLGGGRGFEVRTEGEFDAALRQALADKTQMSLIQVHLSKSDCSQGLRRLAEKLSKRV